MCTLVLQTKPTSSHKYSSRPHGYISRLDVMQAQQQRLRQHEERLPYRGPENPVRRLQQLGRGPDPRSGDEEEREEEDEEEEYYYADEEYDDEEEERDHELKADQKNDVYPEKEISVHSKQDEGQSHPGPSLDCLLWNLENVAES